MRRDDLKRGPEDLRATGAANHKARVWRSFYSTLSRAPWQLKPAPKEDINHQPPGAFSFRAECNVCRTNGLLMFPRSRRMRALQQRSVSES